MKATLLSSSQRAVPEWRKTIRPSDAMMNVAGYPSRTKKSGGLPSKVNIGTVYPNLSAKLATVEASSGDTQRKATRLSSIFSYRRCMLGNSAKQGAHQVAQK